MTGGWPILGGRRLPLVPYPGSPWMRPYCGPVHYASHRNLYVGPGLVHAADARRRLTS